MTYPSFSDDIARMNATYELPAIKTWQQAYDRVRAFESILKEECTEILGVEAELDNADDVNRNAVMLRARVMLADLLGDIIVYCASEAQRWGIDFEETLAIIMASNFSKLGADGKPIKDERGKFLKGPNYWKPEPYIQALLEGYDILYKSDGTIAVYDPAGDIHVPIDMDAVVAKALEKPTDPSPSA